MDQKNSVSPLAYLQAIDPRTATAFSELRKAVVGYGPLDHATVELILTATFAARGNETGFKNHSRALLKAGVDKEKIRHAMLVTLGATLTIQEVVRALAWLDDVVAEV